MALSVKEQLSSLQPLRDSIRDEKKRGVVGAVGALRCPPLISVCALIDAVDITWSASRDASFTARISPDIRGVVMQPNSRYNIHLAHYDDDSGGITPWPFDDGRREVEIKVNDRVVKGDLDPYGRAVPSQLLLAVEQQSLDKKDVLSVYLKKVIEPAPPPGGRPAGQREWGNLSTIVVLVTCRLELVTLRGLFNTIREADQGHGGAAGNDGISMLCEVSWHDPVVGGKIHPPMVRGAACTHLQCFDLNVYLTMAQHRGALAFKWECPVCSLPIYWNDLVRDTRMEAFTKKHPNVLKCRVDIAKWSNRKAYPDYQWEELLEEGGGSDDSSDMSLDGPSKPAKKSAAPRKRKREAEKQKSPPRSARGNQRQSAAKTPRGGRGSTAAADPEARVVSPSRGRSAKGRRSDAQQTPVQKKGKAAAAADESQPAALHSCEDYVRLASHLANFLNTAECAERQQGSGPRKEIEEYGTAEDVLEDLQAVRGINTQYVKKSGLLGFLKQLAGLNKRSSRRAPCDTLRMQKESVANRATLLLRQWGLEEKHVPKEGSSRGSALVSTWLTDQSQQPRRQVVRIDSRLFEATSDTQLVRMHHCPIYKHHYRPSVTPSDVRVVSDTNTVGEVVSEEDGHWVLDTLLGECFLYTPHGSVGRS